MQKLTRIIKALLERFWFKFRRRYAKIMFAGHLLTLDTRWKHELDYLKYIKQSEVDGPIGMDVWTFSHFVKPGYIVLDAGANIGFTALLAERAGAAEIHCFEPDLRLIERLKAHCQGDKFFVYPMALGDNPCSLQLRLSSQHNQGSTLSDIMIRKFPDVFQGSESLQVDVRTIDGIFGDKGFDFFKIDVEGAEISVLRGASSMLKSSLPSIIYIETYEEFFEEVHGFLEDYYNFAYRVICDRNGNCRLVPLTIDISQIESKDLYTMPPSYIYSKLEQKELTKYWTRPVSSKLHNNNP